jgi:hypothetical protein
LVRPCRSKAAVRGSAPDQYLKELRDIRIAQRIALAKEAGVKVEAAKQEAADAHNLDHKTVRDIWSRLARRASTQLQRLRMASERQGLTDGS